MKLLSIDCSTEACSVAISANNQIVEDHQLAARQHTQQLLPMVDNILAKTGLSIQQLDAIAFGCGPGSFTGLRICLGAVQGLAYGADIPVIPISSLAALAQTAIESSNRDDLYILSTLDARMDEVYWGLYRYLESGNVVLEDEEKLSSPEKIFLPDYINNNAMIIPVGSGWKYDNRIPGDPRFLSAKPDLLPKASAISHLAARNFEKGLFMSADKIQPSYFRDEVAWKKQH